jgi:protein-tyrosine phosphatase
VIDIHAHLLPGIDDGPRTLEDAIALAPACARTGVTDIFLTPHVFPGRWDNTRSTIATAFERFRATLQDLQVPLRLHMGGEVRLDAAIFDLLERDELPFLGEVDGYKTLLLELPDGSVPVGSDRLVRYLLDRRIRPVIVHPERNKGVMEKPDRMRPFVEMGCILQLTAASVIGEFGPAALRTSQLLIDRGWADLVASDTHNLAGRAPRMDAARDHLASTYGAEVAHDMTRHEPARITGLPLPKPKS